MNKIEAISVRVDMINGQFDLNDETTKFMKLVREKHSQLAKELQDAAPETCDVGRFIAALDSLQHTKNLFCDSAIIGSETTSRKKRKIETEK